MRNADGINHKLQFIDIAFGRIGNGGKRAEGENRELRHQRVINERVSNFRKMINRKHFQVFRGDENRLA